MTAIFPMFVAPPPILGSAFSEPRQEAGSRIKSGMTEGTGDR